MSHYHESSFSVREPAWHGLAAVHDRYPNDWDEAREWAGLTWEPELKPLYLEHVELGDDGVSTGYRQVPKVQAVVRNDSGKFLGTVSDAFELISHAQMGEIVEALIGAGAKFETAGSLKEGAVVWCLVSLDEPVQVAGDDTPTLPFLAVLNAHDGSGACKAIWTAVRIVCWNTYSYADMLAERDGNQFVFRHTSGVNDRIEDAKAAMSGARAEVQRWTQLADELAQINYDDARVRWFLDSFIPLPASTIEHTERQVANIERARSLFMSSYNGVTCDEHRGTALGVLDAAVEYLDHMRGYRNPDTYVSRTVLRPEPAKARAFKLVKKIAELDRAPRSPITFN